MNGTGACSITIHPNKTPTAGGIRFGIVVLFIFSAFVMSNDSTLKLGSVNLSSLVALLMLGFFLVEGLSTGVFSIRRHSLQAPLCLLFLWALASLLLSWINPFRIMPEAVYYYEWTRGLNSPALRGFSFLARLFFSIIAIEFLVSAIDTRKRFFTAVNAFIAFYAIASLFGTVQLLLYFFLGIEIGNIITYPNFRIGGYVGEPQTYGILLVSGLFLIIAAIRHANGGVRFSKRFLKVILVMALLDLVFTFSVSMFVAVLVALAVFSNEIRKRTLLIGAFATGVLVFVFYSAVNARIVAKLMSEAFSVNSRTLTWSIGYKMFLDNIWTGVGIGQSPLLSESVSNTLNFRFASLDFYTFRVNTLNTYIEWAAETGLIGLALLAWLVFRAWRLGRARTHSPEIRFVRFAFGGALLAICVSANSYGGALYIGCLNLVFAMYVAGMALFNPDKPKVY